MTASILVGDALEQLRALPDESVQCCVTSPPYYGLRDYGVDGQIGLEPTPAEFIGRLVDVFREVRRVLRADGIAWVNMGDSYASAGGPGWQGKNGNRADRRFTATRDSTAMRGIGRAAPDGMKPKDLMGMPWRLAFALQADGWYLRQDIIWHKPNPMPESIRDRCTKAHEYVFLLSKSERYFYDADTISEPASEDTHARYARGRSDTHKYADGGPGNQTIAKGFEHMRKPVAGWMTGPGSHDTLLHAASPKYRDSKDPRPRSKAGLAASERKFKPRKLADPGSGTKNNGSFDAAMAVMPERRNRRSVWTITSEPFTGAAFDGSDRKASRDCPIHGERAILASMAERGGPPAAFQSGRNRRTCDHPDQLQLDALAPIATRLDAGCVPDGSDSPVRSCDDAATRHSSESHRTGRARSTSPHETRDEVAACCIADSEPSGALGASADHTPANSIAAGCVADDADFDRAERTDSSSEGTCTCPQIIDHFAVFPTELPRLCILAGSRTGDTILDPFAGSGTTLQVALELGRKAIGIELNPEYVRLIERRLSTTTLGLQLEGA